MIKVFVTILTDVPYIPLLYPNLGIPKQNSILFLGNAFRGMDTPFVEMVSDPSNADYILIPHNFSAVAHRKGYIKQQSLLAHKYAKKLIIFWHGDSDASIHIPNAIVFRTSQYGYTQNVNEVMMPAYAEDLSYGEIQVRAKHSGKPIIGFCGWADYKNTKNRLGTLIKNSVINALRLCGNQKIGAKRKGIWFRMQAIKILQKSDVVQPHFIIRSSYSGHIKTIKTDVEQTRKDYVHNMMDSDYALIVKGDGNYSYRFYEALSLGRIPVLLDTDCILPLEDRIDYDSFVLRVDYKNMAHLDAIIAQHYRSLSNKDFQNMQKMARDAYQQYLSVQSYFRFITEHIL